MTKISDFIRNFCARYDGIPLDNIGYNELRTIADRIDSEIVELPKDANGEIIHVGDIVRKSMYGKEMTVKELYLLRGQRWVIASAN